jgi:hypothetical protein
MDMNRMVPLFAAAAALILVGSIVLSSYTVEFGLAKPGMTTRRIVVAVAEIDATLGGAPDFVEFSEALYAGLAAQRALAQRTPADNRAGHAIEAALDCYTALREAWQAELEGIWDPAIHGDPAYWRSFHSAVQLPAEGPLQPAELREMLRLEALGHVQEALAIVER